jgi:hypothetical protein
MYRGQVVLGRLKFTQQSHLCQSLVALRLRSLREEHRLRVLENRVLRIIYGPKRDDVTGEWRKLHNEEFHNLYSSPDIIRQINSR